jgi:hypothetical protein
MTQEHKLNLFADAIYLMDKQDLEKMIIELAWKETTIEQIVDSVFEDTIADEWGGQDQ